MYIYPDNMKSKANLFLWRLRDIVIIVIGTAISIAVLSLFGFVYPFALVSMYAFLSIRYEDTSICDYISYAFMFCVSKQQLFYWRWEKDESV